MLYLEFLRAVCWARSCFLSLLIIGLCGQGSGVMKLAHDTMLEQIEQTVATPGERCQMQQAVYNLRECWSWNINQVPGAECRTPSPHLILWERYGTGGDKWGQARRRRARKPYIQLPSLTLWNNFFPPSMTRHYLLLMHPFCLISLPPMYNAPRLCNGDEMSILRWVWRRQRPWCWRCWRPTPRQESVPSPATASARSANSLRIYNSRFFYYIRLLNQTLKGLSHHFESCWRRYC